MSQHIKFMTTVCCKSLRTLKSLHEEYLLKLRQLEYNNGNNNSNVTRITDNRYIYIFIFTFIILILFIDHLILMMVNIKYLLYKKKVLL